MSILTEEILEPDIPFSRLSIVDGTSKKTGSILCECLHSVFHPQRHHAVDLLPSLHLVRECGELAIWKAFFVEREEMQFFCDDCENYLILNGHIVNPQLI